MKSTILLFLGAVIIFSCKDKKTSAENLEYSIKKQKFVDSAVKSMMANVYWDTIGTSEAPIKVVKAWLSDREYSTYKNISLLYKNVSDKKVEGIKFRWYGETVFGDPADMGTSLQEGFGSGYVDNALKPGASRTSEWSMVSENAKKIIQAWPYEVVFSDGTKWKAVYKN